MRLGLFALGLLLLATPALAEPWPTAHGGPANDRSAASAITPENVATLHLAWRQPARGAVTGTPVHDGSTAFFADWDGHVSAVNVSTGKIVWSVDVDQRIDASLALAGGSVLAGDATGNLTALDAKTGRVRWTTWVEPLRGIHLWGSPSVHEGRVFLGIASDQTDVTYEGPQDARGGVACLDLATGAILWKTYMQAPGAFGVSVWSSPALDPALGLLFVGTGNAYGEPAGDHSDSLVALRMDDGAIAWSFQATKDDGFNARGASGPDADFGASPLLFDLSGRPVVADGDKAGRFFALDRKTGELIWQTKADFVAPGATPAEKEGFLATAAYANGTIFAPTTDRSMVHAIDATTGRIRWSRELNAKPASYGERMFGPATETNGIVFQGNAFGQLFALDARDGHVLATIDVGGDVQAGVSFVGDTVLVPDAGDVLWSGQGNLSAYRLGAKPSPTPTTAKPAPSTPTGATTPTILSPVLVDDGSHAAAQFSKSPVPGWGVSSLILVAAAAAAGRRAKRRS